MVRTAAFLIIAITLADCCSHAVAFFVPVASNMAVARRVTTVRAAGSGAAASGSASLNMRYVAMNK